jgi:FtsZ-interacting cell division protein ZipA
MKKKITIVVVAILIVGFSVFGYNMYSNRSEKNPDKTQASTKTEEKDKKDNGNKEKDEITDANSKEVAENEANEKEVIENSKTASEKESLDVVKSLIENLYFNKGSYSEYKSMFAFPDKVLKEDRYNEIRSNVNITEKFGSDYKSADEIMKHMVITEGSQVTVVEFKPNKDKESTMKWNVLNKDGKTLIYNAVIEG